jgi:hypothetical protein
MWKLSCIRSLNAMIDGVCQMGKGGDEITLHMSNQFGDFDLRMAD